MLAGTGRASLTSARLGASRTLAMIFSSQKKHKILTWDANPHVGGRSNKDLFYLFCRGCPEFCSAVGSDITYCCCSVRLLLSEFALVPYEYITSPTYSQGLISYY